MPHPLAHDFADLGDVRLHYVTAGKGPAVVLLHGWPQTWFMWRKILPGLAEHYRVIASDLRGLGDSSRPATGYDRKTVAHDVWRLVHDVPGEKRFSLGGPDQPEGWLDHHKARQTQSLFASTSRLTAQAARIP
jgi:pimeloyl-ACP methyl ester carboxylesterase